MTTMPSPEGEGGSTSGTVVGGEGSVSPEDKSSGAQIFAAPVSA